MVIHSWIMYVMSSEPKPAPVNLYNGTREREEIFEFAEKPKITREGNKWIIIFATKGKCDVTVSILDKEGKVIRHLACGVLGENAPYPLQQNSLKQRLEWDGLSDRYEKVDVKGCKAKVSLGLKATFEFNIAYSPYYLSGEGNSITQNEKDRDKYLIAEGPDGNMYILSFPHYALPQGRVFNKDGKYISTFWPPSANELEKLPKAGIKLATTKWGDKVPIILNKSSAFALGDFRKKPLKDAGRQMFDFMGITEIKEIDKRPENIPLPGEPCALGFNLIPRMTVHHHTDDLYAGGLGMMVRYNGKTGERDKNWKTPGKWGKPDVPWKYFGDTVVGLDGLIYARYGEHERFLVRYDMNGMIVPFKDAIYPSDPNIVKDKYGGKLPPQGALISGGLGTGNVYMNGLDVAEDGTILLEIHSWQVTDLSKTNQLRVALADSNKTIPAARELGVDDFLPKDHPSRRLHGGYFITLWTNDGKVITRDAVEGKGIGDGAYIDRYGNIYIVQGGLRRPQDKKMYGIVDYDGEYGGRGSLLKFRGLGGKYPVGKFYGRLGYYGDQGTPVPHGMQLTDFIVSSSHTPVKVWNVLWSFDVCNQSFNDCNCSHVRFYLDHWERTWMDTSELAMQSNCS